MLRWSPSEWKASVSLTVWELHMIMTFETDGWMLSTFSEID